MQGLSFPEFQTHAKFGRAILLSLMVLGVAVSTDFGTCIKLDVPFAERLVSEVKETDAIFLGNVERIDFIKDVPNEFLEKRREIVPGLTWETKTTVFRVDRFWKGIDDDEISIISDETRNSDGTRSGPSSDEYDFEKGKTYLVFARNIDGFLRSSECSFTRRDDQIEEILPLLGEGKTPPKPEPSR
jgi:hypothetical protein